jgi:hypothetical protein
MTKKPKPKPKPKPKDDKKVVRVWPKRMKRPPPRYRIEDTNPGD